MNSRSRREIRLEKGLDTIGPELKFTSTGLYRDPVSVEFQFPSDGLGRTAG